MHLRAETKINVIILTTKEKIMALVCYAFLAKKLQQIVCCTLNSIAFTFLPEFWLSFLYSKSSAPGNLLSLPLIPLTAMIYKFLAPVLSAQLITAPTGRLSDIRNLFPYNLTNNETCSALDLIEHAYNN